MEKHSPVLLYTFVVLLLSLTATASGCSGSTPRLKACTCKDKVGQLHITRYESSVCRWNIYTNKSNHYIRLKIIELDAQPTKGCTVDYLEVFDGDSNTSSSLGRWCGTETPTIDSTGEDMFVVYHTMNNGTWPKGFSATYSAVKSQLAWWAILLIVVGSIVPLVVVFILIYRYADCEGGGRTYGSYGGGGGGGGCGGGGGGCGGGGC